ncbi:ester cyclase [Geothrix sp.]|uniref:ester cyclase n=1 Tax=Geothrix sp. TaxID=1962974 RepID=UPI0025BE2711|nr:ester cyclase [Geothrix sp.]
MAPLTHLRRRVLVLVAGALLQGALGAQESAAKAAPSELSRYRAAEKLGRAHLAKFDTLDFDVYSNQRWDRFPESHAPDILVHYPDGHTTKGLEAHIAELKPMFVFAPDTHIKVHPVKITQGEWTSVIGVMEGTFTQPMPIGDGKTIAPTGKAFKLMMSTVGHWKGGTMDEEYLFWDNQAFMKQLGLAQ